MTDYMPIKMRSAEECRWDAVSLGEVMLRFDPGERRITQARQFEVWEGGGEYNVTRGLSHCFRQRTSIVTALVDNPVGRLIENLVQQGGVDVSHILWREFDGVGTDGRNGLYFLERGFGVRPALGCMDRGHTAVAQLRPGDIPWDELFGNEGVRWFHTGGIFCALSGSTPAVAREAMEAARRHGTVVSFDCNYRSSLWKSRGGRQAAAQVNRELMPYADVLFGHEGDLALDAPDAADQMPSHTAKSYGAMAARVAVSYPNLQVIATTNRGVRSATRNDWSAFAFVNDAVYASMEMQDLEILDRVGAGDSFAAGVIFGLLAGKDIAWSLNCGVAHGALVMTTAGDNSHATRSEVERLMNGGGAGVQR